MVMSAVLVIAYVIASRPNGLEGDQAEYHQSAVFFADGRPFWSTLPFGIEHPSMAKAPGYPAWIGSVYTVFGASPTKLGIVQGLIFAPLGVLGTWLLARRLFGDPVAAISAFAVALFPLVWEYYGLLYPEVLAVPLTTFTFWLFLERQPSWKLAAGVGAVVGAGLLVRPTAGFLFAGIAAAWIISAGFKRGAAFTAVTVVAAALVVFPWTIRNMLIEGGGFVPISYQDAAGFGTFNDESANDPVYPYAWRPFLADPPDVLEGPPVSDYEVREELQADTFEYIGDHPFSVVEAFYWNGLTRFWDVRRPARAMDDAPFEGRSDVVTAVGLGIYYLALPLAIAGLWLLRRRRSLVIPLLATALAASLIFTVASTTRYRATLEPVIVILAVSVVAGAARNRSSAPLDEGRARTETPAVEGQP